MKNLIKSLACVALLLTAGCTTTQPTQPTAPVIDPCVGHHELCQPAPIYDVPAAPVAPCPGKWCYDAQLSAALNANAKALLQFQPKDANEWCMSKYPSKLAFYLKLIASMAKYESGYKPDTSYTENFKDNRGNFVISTGLLQVSSESCAGYGMPYLQNAVLKKPENNLECTARILNKWIPRDGVISQTGNLGAGRYWSVMRVGSTHKREQIKAMVCNGP